MRKLLVLLLLPALIVATSVLSGCRVSRRFFDNLTASPSFYGSYQIHEGRQNDAVFGASITFSITVMWDQRLKLLVAVFDESVAEPIPVAGPRTESESNSEQR